MTITNRSLREDPRDRRATIIPSKDTLSILDWLRQQGRLIEQAPEIVTPLTAEEIGDDLDDLIDDDDYVDDFGGDDDD